MTLRRARPLGVRQWPPLLLRYGLIFPPGAVLTTAAFWPMWQGQPLLALGNEFLSLAAAAPRASCCSTSPASSAPRSC